MSRINKQSGWFNSLAGPGWRGLKLGMASLLAWAALGVWAAAPLNNNFVNAQAITGGYGSLSADNTGATVELGEPIHNPRGGTNTVWYRWVAPQAGLVVFDTFGTFSLSGEDTVLAAYVPRTVPAAMVNMIQMASNDNANGRVADSLISFLAQSGTEYYIAVAGVTNSTGGAFALHWNMPDTTANLAPAPANTIRFASATFTVDKYASLGYATITVLYGGGSASPVTVDYAALDGTGVAGFDYLCPPGTITFDVGQRIQTFVVAILNNTTADGDRNLFLKLSNAAGGAAVDLTYNFARLDIIDQNTALGEVAAGEFSFTSDAYTVSETEGPAVITDARTIPGAMITVNRLNGSVGRVWVDWIATDQLTGAFVDNGTLVFDDGQTSTNFVIPLFLLPQPTGPTPIADASVDLVLVNPRPDPLENADVVKPVLSTAPLTHVAAVLTIVNIMDPMAKFAIESFHYRVDDYGNRSITVAVILGGNWANANASVVLSIGSGKNFPMVLADGSDYATPGADFTATSVTLQFQGAHAGAWRQTYTIPIISDTLVEFNEDIGLWIHNAGGNVSFGGANPPPAVNASVNGEASTANVTILYNNNPPGMLDREWNPPNVAYTTPPFNTVPGANNQVFSVALQPDQKTLLGGDFTGINAVQRNRIARLNFDGSMDTTFGAYPNTGANSFVSKVLALSGTGNVTNILIAGGFTSYNGTLRNCIARLLPDGSLDTTFFPGAGANGPIWDMAVQLDGKIVIAGEFTRFNETDRNHLARLNPDGSLDTSFDPLTGANDTVMALGFDAGPLGGQKIYVGGRFTGFAGEPRNRIACVNTNGSIDTTFVPGRGANGPVFSLAVQQDGRILIGGSFSEYNSKGRINIARLNLDGSLDATFDPGKGANDAVYTIILRPDGRPYIGGIFTAYNETRRVGLAMLQTDGTLDTRFMDTAYNQFAGVIKKYSFDPNNYINTIALQTNGDLMVGGSFTNMGGNRTLSQNEAVGISPVWTRQDKAVRYNVARLVGTWGQTSRSGNAVTNNPEQGPGNIDFAFSSYSVDENAGALAVTLTRTDGLLGTLEATLATSNRTAMAGQDYVATNSLEVFPEDFGFMVSDGSPGPVYFWVPIIDDTVVEGSEVVDLVYSKAVGSITLGGEVIPLGGALGRTVVPMTIVDNDFNAGTLSFDSDTYTIGEWYGGTTNIVLTVIRTNGFTGTVAVDYYTLNGTNNHPATATNDFTYTSGRLTFYSGEVSKTITVPILHDGVVEFDETFRVVLTNATGGAVLTGGTPTSTQVATVTIIDSDYLRGRVNFTPTNYTVAESGGSVGVIVTRTGGNAGPLAVSVITSNGTALSGLNYTYTSNRVSWVNGESTPRIVTIPILDDSNYNLDRQFTVRLLNPTLANDLGDRTNATITIINDDFPGNFVFSQSLYAGDENGTKATITVLRRNGIAGTVSVNFSTGDNTAFAGTDYVSTNGTLTFGPGEVSKTFDVVLVDNIIQDGNRVFNLALSSPTSGATLGTPATAQMMIWDDESYNQPAGTIDSTFATGSGPNRPVYSLVQQPDNNLVVAGEFTSFNNIPAKSLTRILTGGDLDSTFDVGSGFNEQLRAVALQSDGKILVGGFFTNVNTVNRSHVARLYLDGSLDDYFDPGAGTDGAVYAIAVQPNDGRVFIGGAFTSFNGVNRPNLARLNTNGTLNVEFNAGNGPNGTVYAMALQSDGKLLIGGDFTQVNNMPQSRIARLYPDGRLDTNFVVGAGAGAAVRALAVQSDGMILVGGSFTNFSGVIQRFLVRLQPNGALDPSFLAGQAGPDDAVYAIALQVDEKILVGGSFSLFNNVIRNHITRLNKDGSNDPSINFGLGANGFVATIVVQPDRKIVLGGGFTMYDGMERNNLVRIHGGSLRGNGSFEFATPYYSVVENQPVVILDVVRRGGTFGQATVDYSLFDGLATAGQDYVGTNNVTVPFQQAEIVRHIMIQVLDDTLVENPEDFYAMLDNPTGGADIGLVPLAIVVIYSDDTILSFSNPIFNVNENTPSGSASITVVRSGSVSGTVTVDYNVLSGTASNGLDFVGTSGTLTFGPGISNQIFVVPILDDLLSEGNETAFLTLSNAQPFSTVTLGLSNAVLNIIDNETVRGILNFSASNYAIGEFDTTAVITVVRTNGSSGVASIQYATSDGTATNGIDYLAANGVLSFMDGETVKTFNVSILPNPANTNANKALLVHLFNPVGGVLGRPANATVTIAYQNVSPSIAFATPSFGANAWETNALITVVRSNYALRGTVKVDYYTYAGTATPGKDYTNVSGTVSFDPTNVAQPFFIPVVNNPWSFSPKTVSLVLTNARFDPPRPDLQPPIITLNQSVLTVTNTPPAGSTDNSFYSRFWADGPVYALMYDEQQRLFVGGEFGYLNELAVNRIGRMNTNGTADLTFNPGLGPDATVYAIGRYIPPATGDTNIVTTNGLYIGGAFMRVDSGVHFSIARLFADGTVDPSFNTNAGPDGTVLAIAVQDNQQPIIAGTFTNVDGQMCNHIARLTTNGAMDINFQGGLGANSNIYALAFTTNGQILAAGDFTSFQAYHYTRLARLNTNGVVDTNFYSGLGADGVIRALAVQSDGSIIIGGDFVTVDGVPRNHLARLTPDGRVDLTFDPGTGATGNMTGMGVDGSIRCVTIQTSGKIVVGGVFTHLGGNAYGGLGRFNPNGSVDDTFALTGGADGPLNAVALANGMSVVNVNRVAEGTELEDRYTVDTHANRGTVIIDYDFLSIPDDIRIYYGPIRIFELYTNDVGHLEIPFGPGPYTTITIVMNEGNGEPGTYWLYTGTIIGGGVVDKRIACGGEFTKMNGLPRNHVTIVDSSGVLDRDFDPGADGSTQVYALGVYTNSLQSDLQGKVVVGGDFKQMVGVSPQYNISRLLRDGAMDRTFNAGVGPDQAVRALAVQPDGKVIMGGFFTNVNLTLRAFLARLNLDGKLDFAFNPGVFNGGPGLNGPVLALALQPDGKTIVGGQFSSVYGASRNGIARVHTNGTVDVTFAPGAGANGQVRALALQSDGRVVIGGDFTLVNNTNRSRVARLNADGTLDLAFNPGLGANAALLAVAVQGDGKILIGGLFTNFNGVARAGLARLNVDGTLDATFNPGTGANDYVSSITVQPDGLIVVGGGFTQFNNQYRHRLARLTSTGAFDPTVNFGVGANNFVNTLLLEPDHQILVGGGFTDMDRQPCVAIARINGGTNVGNGSFYLSATSYSVSEAGTNAQITVLRGGGAAGAVSVQYATADGTAHTPTDYTGTNGTLTFQPAENVQTITVTVSNNTIIDGNRTFGISIFNPSVGVVDTLSNAVVTIVDNDCVLSFTSTNYLVAENAGGARISVARQGALDQTVTVDFTTTTNGTATANLDYIPAQGRLTFGPGMRTLSFEVPVLDDGVSEFDESVGLLLTNAVGPVTLVQSNAWLTIVDVHPSPGILTFTLTNYTVMENGTNALITVIRTNGHSGVVSVNFATYDGTATNNLDYRATNGVLVFAENETNKTFTVPIINRTNSLDGDRIVSLVLSAPSGGAMFPTNLGATNLTATLTIIEDEVPMAKFSLAASNYTVGEAAGLLTVTVNRSGQTNGVVSVDYGTVPTGSAVAGLDYTPVVGTLFWASNDVAPKTFTVPIVDNTQVNPDRTFMVFLQNPLAPVPWLAQLLSPSNAIVRIVNDDSANPPTGGTDTTFGDHWFANSNVHAVVFDDAAQLIVGGDFTYMHGLAQGHISRLTTNALVDTSFATGQGFDNSVYALAPNTTNVLAVGGNFTNYNGVSAGRIIVLQANGLPDPTFNFGSGVDGPVRALGWTAAQSTNFAAFSGQGTNNSYTQTIPLIVDVGTLSMNYAFTPPYVANPTNRVTYTNTLSIRYGGFPIYTTNVVVTSNAVFGSIVALPFGPGGVPPTIAIAVNAGRTNGCPWSYDGVINYGGTGGRALYLGGNFLLLNGQVQTRVARVTMNGAIDMGFNVGAGPNATVLAIAPLASGQVLIGGEFTTVNNYAMPHLARLNVDGSLDTTFRPGSGYGTDKPVRAIVVQADGSIIIGGDFQSVGGVPRNGVTRLNPDGSVDLTFDPGLGASGSVYSLALQPDGLVIVVGDFTGIGGNSFTRLARLNANGSVDSSFNPGTGANALVRSTSTITQPVAPTVLTLPTATGTATADFRTYETGASNGTVAIDYAFYFGTSDLRIYYDGSLIYELATNGFGQTGPISYGPGASTQITIVVNETGAASYTYWSYTATVTTSNAPDVRVALGGDFTRVNDLPRRRVAVLNGSGVPVPSFDPGTVGNIAVYSIGVFTNPAQPSLIGKIVAGGDFTSIEGALQNRLARLNFDGTIDPAFDIGTGPDAMVRAVAVQADGMVLAGGSFKNVNGVPRAYLARFRANGMVDATYNAGTGPDNAINALALPPDGRPFIGGVFTHVYGLSRSGVARLKQDGTVDPSFDPGMGANNGTVKALALPLDGMSLFVGGDFTSVNSQGGSARLARLFTNGAVDTTFVSPLNNGTVNALAVQTDGKVLVGGTFTLGANVNLARLNSDGTVDGTFTTGTGANDYVSSITIQPDGLILVGGGFTMFNGQMHQRLVRLNHDGSFDGTANFGLGANNFINDVKLQGFDGKIIVGGAFTEFDGQVRIGIARIFSGTNLGVGAFQFSAPAFSVNEDASNAVITVVRVGGATGAVRVNFATSDGTAVAGRDYVATAGTLYFATGESAQTISVVPINNSLADGTRGFNLTLSNPGGGAALGASNTVASVSILDDESVISFSVSQYSVLSDAGSARISVTRTGGITRAVTVDCFTTTNGSAAPLLNYVSSAATVVFNPGVSAQTFYVPVLSTPTIDPPLTVPLVLSNVTGPAVLGLAQATLTIADDQVGPGVLSFSTNSYSVVEDMGVATISVVRTGGFFGAISVNFATVLGGSAPPLAKYYPTNGVLTFADGETNKSFMVGIVNNNIVEGTETVLLRLSGATGGATIAGANAVLSIIDDDTYGSFAFASAVFTVNEGGTEAAINVRRIGGANYASAVSFQTSGGTAVPGVHYTSVSNVLQFALGETNKTVQIPLGADDLTATGTRTVGLLLSNPTPTNGPVIGVPGAATLWILDHETSFSFTTNDYYISEINGNASISVARVGSTNTGASVAFSATSGTALDGLDFVGTNGVINFAPGQTVTNFLVRILRNTQVTGDRALNLTLSTPSGGGALGPIVVARLTIRDVDVALNFSAPTYVTNEGAFQAIITVVRSGATNTQTSVDYTTADGTATSTGLNANYVAAAGTLVFLPGQLTNSFNVFLLHNLIAQGDVMVLLSLLNPSGGALVGGQGAAVLTIQDMDSAVGFLSTNYVVNSQDGFANITLIRKGAVTSNDVTVFLVTSNDTAHAGVDYVRYTNVVHWAGNDMTPKTNAIVILDDGIANGAKRVGLYLLNPSTNAYVDPSQASLMIVDNGGSIAFSATTASVVEGNTLVITLLRTGGTNGEVSVQYRPIGGNATPGVDFLYPAGVVTFASGETSKSISIPVVSDGLAEGLETVLFALTNAAGGARVGSPNQMNVTIVDGDLGIVQAAGSALVKEEGSITNGMIDPNEIVTLELGLRNVGYVNTTTNFRAMLLSTNLLPGCGIVMTNNSLLATQSYGILEAGGSVVSRPFRFRAVGTNGGQITATLVLMENGLTNGTATFIFSLGGNGTTIGPASSITINDNAPASPYPSVLHVAGLVGKVNKVTVTIIGLQHGYAPDIDMILVGPQGTNVVLMSDAGSFTSADNVTITFDDAASHPLPYDTTRITNGTYIPSNYEGLNDVFPSGLGVPVPPYGTSLAVFNGSDPNGDWKLFVADDSSFFAGTIAGWSLSISNSESVASVADVSVKVAGTPNPVAMNGRLTYTLAVTNHGPGTASNVVMTNYLPVGVSGVTPSLSPSVAGSVTSDPVLNTVVASLSRLTNGQGVLMTVVVTVPGNASVLTDVATVSAASIDQYAGNNTDSVKTQVAVPPTIGTLNKPGSLVLSWPMSAGNFVLVSATNLPARPEDWIQVPNVPPPFNGTNTVSLPVGSGTMFYRLRLTP